MTYGCHNRRSFSAKRIVPNGHWLDGQSFVIKAESIKVTATRDCQYTLSDRGRVDKLCDGCRWRTSDAKKE